jgi:hypothetical protein
MNIKYFWLYYNIDECIIEINIVIMIVGKTMVIN